MVYQPYNPNPMKSDDEKKIKSLIQKVDKVITKTEEMLLQVDIYNQLCKLAKLKP